MGMVGWSVVYSSLSSMFNKNETSKRLAMIQIVFIKASIRKYFDTNFVSIKFDIRIYCSCLSVTNIFIIPIAVPVSANPIPAPVGITVNVIKV